MQVPLKSLIAFSWIIGFTALAPVAQGQTPLGTSFTYQGRLKNGGSPVDGTACLRFTLWSAETGGTLLVAYGGDCHVTVVDGLFTANVDFGSFNFSFNGEERWIEIQIDTDQDGMPETVMSPRQKVTAVPYALRSKRASALDAPDGSPFNAVYVDANGIVGVNTILPNSNFALNVNGGLGPFWRGGVAAGGGTAAVVTGELNGVATLGAHNGTLDAWQDLSINPIGNVGIGTTTPTSKLSVAGDVDISGARLHVGTNGNVGIGTSTPGQKLSVVGVIEATVGGVMFPDGTIQNSAPWSLGVPSGGTEAIDQSSPFFDNILNNGQDNPWQSFTAGTSGFLTGVTIRPQAFWGIVNLNLKIYAGEGTGGALLSTTAIALDTGNPVSEPKKLVIPLATAPWVDSGSKYTFQIANSSTNWWYMAHSGNLYLLGRLDSNPGWDAYFQTHVTTGTLSDVVTQNPRVGIGTTTPHANFLMQAKGGSGAWQGGIAAGGTSGAVVLGEVSSVATIGAHNGALGAWQDLSINPAGGNVGIGTTTPTQKLHVVGNICATGTIGACSDARFKQNVLELTDALDRVTQLRGVSFDWKRDQFAYHQFADGRQVGFIAQEVEKVLPEVVAKGSDGYRSVDYGRLTPLLVEAMKELKNENALLKARLEKLEGVTKALANEKIGGVR